MARGINKVILIGNLGRDPEQRTMPNGNAVTNLAVATSESWKDKQTGEQQERTEWHRCVLFGKVAEIAGQYLSKGAKVYLEGSLRTRKWQNKETGADQYATEIVCDDMQMLGGDGQQGQAKPAGQAQQGQGGFAQPAQQPQAQPQPQPSLSADPRSAPAGNFNDFDDDIPF